MLESESINRMKYLITDVVAPRSENPRLIITFELLQPICPRYSLPQLHRQTDGRTDGRLTIAIPRGKNRLE